jgi:hypothetical protein
MTWAAGGLKSQATGPQPNKLSGKETTEMADKVYSARLLEGNGGGMFYKDGETGREWWNVHRGDVVETTDEDAVKRWVVGGYAVAGKKYMTCPVEDLPRAHEPNEESESKALKDWAHGVWLRGIAPELRHRVSGTPEYEAAQAPIREAAARQWRRRQPRNDGWIGT